jgi:integrase
MATGRSNYLTKQTGEYLVAAELSRRGFIATTFTGNVPHYDIVAVDEHGGHALVQVKAIAGKSWQFTATDFADIAIGLFAGLRRAELERLDWSEVDFESNLIQVTAEKSKTAARRFVTMQPNLREWLLPHRQLKGGIVEHETFRQSFNHARSRAGITEWPENALRHSFASCRLAHFKNAASTALELGHHDSRVTFAHYRELVRPKDAKRYWQIKPVKTAKVVPMVAR